MKAIVSTIAFAILVMIIWGLFVKDSPRVDIDWKAGERFTSMYDSPNDPNAFREWYILYEIENLDSERGVSGLRFRCGRATTEFEQRDIPPNARMEGTLRVLGAGMGFDPDTCEPAFKMTTIIRYRY